MVTLKIFGSQNLLKELIETYNSINTIPLAEKLKENTLVAERNYKFIKNIQ